MHALFCKISVSWQIKQIKFCFDLFTDKPQTQTNTRNISGTCVVRKKRQSGMSKTEPQAKVINKFVVFWQTNMSWYLLRLIIRQQTFLKYLKCSWFCQSFTAEFIEDGYKKSTKACLQLLVNRDLKHQRWNGTTTLTGSKIFPRKPSGHGWGCQTLVQPSLTMKYREVCHCHHNITIKLYFLHVHHSLQKYQRRSVASHSDPFHST